ncbi:MAG: DUF6115 domain-containing protein [Butyrivibrio sp.]|jgi:DNA-binding NarL/FixJ family response regulator|nr:DUF6115 domain-containing protein [Butyrivibrio sp.]
MSIAEILLMIVGVVAIVTGYLIPAGHAADSQTKAVTERNVHDMVRRSVEDAQEEIQSRVDDTIESSLAKSERGLERITNEKITAISEYADTVLNDIHKNHDEVVFMYDMLNDKHKSLTDTVSEVTRQAEQAKQTILDAEITAKQAKLATDKMNADQFIPLIPDTAVGDAENEQHVIGSAGAAAETESVQNREPEKEPEKAKVVQLSEVQRNESRKNNEEEPDREADTGTDPGSQNRQILEMHKAGKSNMVIARELGLGIGEVGLVIDLSKKHKKVR